MNYTENLYYKALMSKYNAQIAEAEENIRVLEDHFSK